MELGQAVTTSEGTFVIPFNTPTDPPYATVGVHSVFAVQGETQAEVFFELTQGPTPTFTSTVTPTPRRPAVYSESSTDTSSLVTTEATSTSPATSSAAIWKLSTSPV